MNKILIFCFLILSHIGMHAYLLQTIEHNQPKITPAAQLEVGVLKLYFDEIPTVNYVPSAAEPDKHDFIFPHVTADSILQKKLSEILKNKEDLPYVISINSVAQPIPGLKVTLRFNDMLVKTTHASFDAMDGRKGIAFHFFNKQLLNQIERQGRPILHTACMQ